VGTDGNIWTKKANSFKEMVKFNVFTKQRYCLEKREERDKKMKGRRTGAENKARKGRKAK
jgi:hypothetical protein